MRPALVCVLVVIARSAAAAQSPPGAGPVTLRDLVAPSDRLAVHRLTFDASFAREAIDYLRLRAPGKDLFDRMAKSPAIAHLLNHARNFDYDVPKESPEGLLRGLLGARDAQAERLAACVQSIAYFAGLMLADPHWVADVLRYLPEGFRFHGTLFLTFGYDIGVAFGPNASLNCAHPHFKDHPRELVYYAIHELHHTGFMAYQKPLKLADIKSSADLLKLVEYSTQMEGTAVLAAYPRRRDDHTLADDADYLALDDQKRMEADVVSYFRDYRYLKSRGAQPADTDARAVIERMSGGERLWYRVGAHMARRIEESKGRAALLELIKQSPVRFIATYESLDPLRPEGR